MSFSFSSSSSSSHISLSRLFRLLLPPLFPVFLLPLLSRLRCRRPAGLPDNQPAMGRAKLQIRYREDFRSRRSTYMTRMKGVVKKATELSLLCGVDVLLASFSPELNTLQFWPKKDTPEFHRIRERYLYFRSLEKKIDGNGNSEQQTPLSSPSFSMASIRAEEEKEAIEMKLNEVRERLSFLRAYSQYQNLLLSQSQEEEEEWLQAQFMPLQQKEDFHLHQPSSSPFSQSETPCLADFDSMGLPTSSSLLCDSPLRSHSDDLTWCDNLLLDHEYGP